MKKVVNTAAAIVLCAFVLLTAGCADSCIESCYRDAEKEQKAHKREEIAQKLGIDLEPLTPIMDDYSMDFQGWGHYSLVYDLNGSDITIEPGGDWSDANPAPREVDALGNRHGLQMYADEQWHYIWFYREETVSGSTLYKYIVLYDKRSGLLYVYFTNWS